MYVDKRLARRSGGANAFPAEPHSAGKEDTFVLDFVNEAEDIREAFKPFYEVPAVDQQVEPGQLYALQAHPGRATGLLPERNRGVRQGLLQAEAIRRPRTTTHMMHKILNGPVERFEALEEDEAGTLPEATHCISPVVLVHVADHSVSRRRP